jgi:hypothetical protein
MSLARILSLIDLYFLWLCAIGLLALLLALFEFRAARKGKAKTIFSLEKELATGRESRARNSLLIILALLAGLVVIEFGVIPSQPVPPAPEPTPTRMVIELPTTVPVTPTPTVTRIPTRPRPTALPPTETPTSTPIPPPPCPQPGVCISAPAAGQVVSGQVTVQGTANIESFQFYKVEYALAGSPDLWNSIGDVHTTPVVDGTLVVWNTVGFPNGGCKLRLTVVDQTGNFGPPFEVAVVIQN